MVTPLIVLNKVIVKKLRMTKRRMLMFATKLKVKESLSDTQAAKFSRNKINLYQLFKIRSIILGSHKWEKIWLLAILLMATQITERSNWTHPNLIFITLTMTDV